LKVWKKDFNIDLNEVNYVHSIRFFNMVKQLIKKGY
jgi:hypothetical protein